MRIEPVAPGIEVAIGATYESNATLFYDGEEVLMVDAMGCRDDARQLRDYLGAKTVRFIVATHYFSDHMAGLALFPDAMIVAHRNCGHTFESELFRTPEEAAYFVEPSIVVRDGFRIRWGRRTLEIFENAGHTSSTMNVDVPDADLILTGDNLVGDIVYLAYSSPGLIRDALDEIARRGRSNVLSSHGPVGRRRRVERASEYLRRLGDRARQAWRQDSDAIEGIALADCLPDDGEGSEFEQVFHLRNLQFIRERNLFRPVEEFHDEQ